MDNWSNVLTRVPFNGVRVRKSVAQSITAPPNSIYQTVTWDVEDFDTHAYHSAGGSTLTMPSAGFYLVSCAAATGSGGTVFRVMNIFKNGTFGIGAKIGGLTQASPLFPFHAQLIAPFIAGDTVVVQAYSHTSAYDFGSDGTLSAQFSATRLGGNPGVQAVCLRKSTGTGQVIDPGAPQTIVWDTEVFDTANFHASGSGQIIIPFTGRYLIIADIQWYAALIIKQLYASLFLNSTAIDGYRTQSDNQISRWNNFARVMMLNKNDVLEIRASHDAGASTQTIVENQADPNENTGSAFTVMLLDSVGAEA